MQERIVPLLALRLVAGGAAQEQVGPGADERVELLSPLRAEVVDRRDVCRTERVAVAVAAVVRGHRNERGAHDIEQRLVLSLRPAKLRCWLGAPSLDILASDHRAVLLEERRLVTSGARRHGVARRVSWRWS
jgi:hypothetical protein